MAYQHSYLLSSMRYSPEITIDSIIINSFMLPVVYITSNACYIKRSYCIYTETSRTYSPKIEISNAYHSHGKIEQFFFRKRVDLFFSFISSKVEWINLLRVNKENEFPINSIFFFSNINTCKISYFPLIHRKKNLNQNTPVEMRQFSRTPMPR